MSCSSASATELYELIVQEGGIAPDDARVAAGTDAKAALDLLAELNLVQLDSATTSGGP